MATTRDDFQSFASLPLAIDILNNLVMTGAMLCVFVRSLVSQGRFSSYELCL